MFCQATGFGGTVAEGKTIEAKIKKREEKRDESLEEAASKRDLVISFNADVSDGMQWSFVPTQRSVKLKPGQSTLAFYTAQNLSDKAITGTLTWNFRLCIPFWFVDEALCHHGLLNGHNFEIMDAFLGSRFESINSESTCLLINPKQKFAVFSVKRQSLVALLSSTCKAFSVNFSSHWFLHWVSGFDIASIIHEIEHAHFWDSI